MQKNIWTAQTSIRSILLKTLQINMNVHEHKSLYHLKNRVIDNSNDKLWGYVRENLEGY